MEPTVKANTPSSQLFFAAVAVTQQSGGQHKGRQAQGVGIHNPLQPGHIGLQRLLDTRQGQIDDADVQGDHKSP